MQRKHNPRVAAVRAALKPEFDLLQAGVAGLKAELHGNNNRFDRVDKSIAELQTRADKKRKQTRLDSPS